MRKAFLGFGFGVELLMLMIAFIVIVGLVSFSFHFVLASALFVIGIYITYKGIVLLRRQGFYDQYNSMFLILILAGLVSLGSSYYVYTNGAAQALFQGDSIQINQAIPMTVYQGTTTETTSMTMTPRYCWLPQYFCCCNYNSQYPIQKSLQTLTPPNVEPVSVPTGSGVKYGIVTITVQDGGNWNEIPGESVWYHAGPGSVCEEFTKRLCAPLGILPWWSDEPCPFGHVEYAKYIRWKCTGEIGHNAPQYEWRYETGTKFYTWSTGTFNFIWNSIEIRAPDVPVSINPIAQRLTYAGTSSACSGQTAIPNTIGCGFPNQDMYTKDGALMSQATWSLDAGDGPPGTGECQVFFSDSLRTICGYVEDQCTSDADCAARYPEQVYTTLVQGHSGPFGKTCSGTNLALIGCKKKTVCTEVIDNDQDGNPDEGTCMEQSEIGECGIVYQKTVSCCQEGSPCQLAGYFCKFDETGLNSQCVPGNQAPCTTANVSVACGTQEQCNINNNALQIPYCQANGYCGWKTIQEIECCSKSDCPPLDGKERDCINYECKLTEAVKPCPTGKCCIEDSGYKERSCPTGYQCCLGSEGYGECKMECEFVCNNNGICEYGESDACKDCEDEEAFECKDCFEWLQSRLAGAIGGESIKVCEAKDAYKWEFFGIPIFSLHQNIVCPLMFGIPVSVIIIIILYVIFKSRQHPRGYTGYMREIPGDVYHATPRYARAGASYAKRGYRYIRRRY